VCPSDKTLTIECTKTYDCYDDVLRLPWSPGARMNLPEGVAKKILKASPHSFRELTEEIKEGTEKKQEVK
jgi:hypothetical protein